jgi:CRP/FNR family transcriptional regulator
MLLNDPTLTTRQCGDCPIRHRAVCARCETDELDRLDQIKYYRNFEADQITGWPASKLR